MHCTHVIPDKLVIGDCHHYDNQEVETKHHPQQAEKRIVFLDPKIGEITLQGRDRKILVL